MSILPIILSITFLPAVRAAPWQALHATQSKRDDSSKGLSSAIWVPIVAVGVFLLFGAGFVLRRKVQRVAQRPTAANRGEVSTVPNATTTRQTRELTAADLTDATPPTTTTTRRSRRPRRTPSQVSTKSLPAYMKEPGDYEVVIYRGLEDMDEETEGEQIVNNPTTTTPDTTLNTERDSHDITRALLPPRIDSPESVRHSVNISRGSYDPNGSDESHARLIDVRRGEAPAYETIDLDITEEPVPVLHPQSSQSARISGFFSRFMPHRGHNEPGTLSPPPDSRNSSFSPSHHREPSAHSRVSGVTSADSHDSPRGPRAGRTHRDRNNNSSAGSMFTVLSRTLSRDHDDVPLTSPSMISLNSISPPLTHTATRTEFTYPRTGPTSEQVKFLSSKDTFGRFGLPYGPDAIAFASSSRLDLPPDFDSVHQPSFRDISPDPNDGSASSLRRSTSARRPSAGDRSDRGGSPFPESVDPSPDLTSLVDPPSQLSLSKWKVTPDSEVDILTSPSQNSLSKQKSTPNLGVGHPPLSKSALKSKSMANLQNDGDGTLPPRSVSAADSYLTVESFQTAHDDGDGPVPPSPISTLGPIPQIMVEFPSNNPSLMNLADDGSGSETEEFFDGDEGTEGGGSDDEEGGGPNGRGNKTPRAASVNERHQSHAKGGVRERAEEDDPSGSSDEDDTDSSASGPNPKGAQDARVHTSVSSSSDLESGSDDESEAETHSNHTEVDKTLVTSDLETSRISHMHEGTGVTLTPEMVAATLNASSPDLTKTNEVSRTTAIEV